MAASPATQRAIGALIWKDPRRILETAALLRGTDAVLECRLRGGSMGAAIPAGSTLRIDVGRAASARVGEVIAFVRDDGLCVHRVAHRAGTMLVTQGDACFYPDEPIDDSHVLGAVTGFLDGAEWKPVGDARPADRARTVGGRALLGIVTSLAKIDARLAGLAARALRMRKEGPANAEGKQE